MCELSCQTIFDHPTTNAEARFKPQYKKTVALIGIYSVKEKLFIYKQNTCF